jgi:hypothetical protein
MFVVESGPDLACSVVHRYWFQHWQADSCQLLFRMLEGVGLSRGCRAQNEYRLFHLEPQ